MNAAGEVYRVPFLPETWLVPATLADLECRHGRLGGCTDCELEADQSAIAGELELAGTQ